MTPTAKREILKQECHANFPYLLEITDPNTNTVYRYCNMDEDLEVDGVTYVGKAFNLVPFEVTKTKIADGKLNIYDCALEWIPIIRNAAERLEVRFVSEIHYISQTEWELEQIDSGTGTLMNISWDDNDDISCTVKFDDNYDVSMPMDKLDSVVCPALF